MAGGKYVSAPTYQPSFQFSLKWMLFAFTLLASVLWLYTTVAKIGAKRKAEIAERNKNILTTLRDAAKAAEQIRVAKGRAPNDRKEIEDQLGRPLTVDIGITEPYDIYYEKASPTRYHLIFSIPFLEGFTGDYLLFDSATPNLGWVPKYD